MVLTLEDIQSIAALVKQELQPEFDKIDLRFDRMDRRFDEVYTHLDGLAKNNETREQEYLVIREQMSQHDEQLEVHDQRIVGLEKSAA